MTTLAIRDLPASETLSAQALSAVRGGMMRLPLMPYWGGYHVSYKSDVDISASQLIGQTQNVVNNNGNNVAFAHDIRSTVNPTQKAENSIRF
jgi:hypothetical protein